MKKTLSVLAAICMAATQLNAQITLIQSGYPSTVTGTDSLKVTVHNSSFPSLAAMAGGMWDMSTVTDSTPVLFDYRVPVATYQYADSSFYAIAAFGYQGNIPASITSAGIIEYGLNVHDTVYNIATYTSGPADSFIIPAQNIMYSAPRTKVAFPAAFHSQWSSAYHYDFDFQLSVSLLSYSHAAGIVRTYVTEKDSVIGYGKMRVKDLTGSPSVYLNVLQVQTMTIKTDSFFINGVAASSLVLMPLRLTQGQSDTTYEQNYYRVGEVTPLAEVTFSDGSYAAPAKAVTHTQRLSDEGIAGIQSETAISVYPNPVTGNSISVFLPVSNKALNYDLTTITGQAAASGLLAVNNAGVGQVQLPVDLAPGAYLLRVFANGKQVAAAKVQLGR